MPVSFPNRVRPHPVVHLLLFLVGSALIFHPDFHRYRPIVLLLEIALAWVVRLQFSDMKGFLTFLVLNFLSIFLIFYWIDFDLRNAAMAFYNYAFTLLVMFLGAFLFIKTTPQRDLMMALRWLRIPEEIAVGISVALSFLPFLIQKVRHTILYQQARGYRVRIIDPMPIIVPSLLGILELSINIALSLEARGWRSTGLGDS